MEQWQKQLQFTSILSHFFHSLFRPSLCHFPSSLPPPFPSVPHFTSFFFHHFLALLLTVSSFHNSSLLILSSTLLPSITSPTFSSFPLRWLPGTLHLGRQFGPCFPSPFFQRSHATRLLQFHHIFFIPLYSSSLSPYSTVSSSSSSFSIHSFPTLSSSSYSSSSLSFWWSLFSAASTSSPSSLFTFFPITKWIP